MSREALGPREVASYGGQEGESLKKEGAWDAEERAWQRRRRRGLGHRELTWEKTVV